MKDHIKYIKKSLLFIVLFGIVAGGVGYAVSVQRAPMYEAVVSYEIELINRGGTADYQYGSYYDLKGAEIFTQHLMTLLRSAAVIEEIFNSAGIGYTITNLNTFTNQFRTDQGSAQDLTVTFSRYQEDEAFAIANAMTGVLVERTATAQVSTEGHSQFRLRANDPIVIYKETNEWLVAVTALVAGWLLAIVLVYLKRYLKSN